MENKLDELKDLCTLTRYAVDLQVFLYPDGFQVQHPIGQGKVFNMSRYDCKIRSNTKVELDLHLAIRIYVPDLHRQIIIHSAKVIWDMGEDFGLNFLCIQHGEMEILNQFIQSLDGKGRSSLNSKCLWNEPI